MISINSNKKSNGSNQLSLKPKVEENKVLPGSSQPQLLGTITYKDSETSDTSQKIESVESTASVVMEKFETEEKILPQDITIEKQPISKHLL